MILPGQIFPTFRCQASRGPSSDGLIEIDNRSFSGSWKFFLFYPKDFTFVCPTELIAFGKSEGEFATRNVQILGGSTDNEYSHLAWRQSHPGIKNLPYPLLATQKLAQDLGILCPNEGVCLRASLLVDPAGIIQWVSVHSLSVGRSVSEALRVIDAVQSGDLCPCDWSPGEETIKV